MQRYLADYGEFSRMFYRTGLFGAPWATLGQGKPAWEDAPEYCNDVWKEMPVTKKGNSYLATYGYLIDAKVENGSIDSAQTMPDENGMPVITKTLEIPRDSQLEFIVINKSMPVEMPGVECIEGEANRTSTAFEGDSMYVTVTSRPYECRNGTIVLYRNYTLGIDYEPSRPFTVKIGTSKEEYLMNETGRIVITIKSHVSEENIALLNFREKRRNSTAMWYAPLAVGEGQISPTRSFNIKGGEEKQIELAFGLPKNQTDGIVEVDAFVLMDYVGQVKTQDWTPVKYEIKRYAFRERDVFEAEFSNGRNWFTFPTGISGEYYAIDLIRKIPNAKFIAIYADGWKQFNLNGEIPDWAREITNFRISENSRILVWMNSPGKLSLFKDTYKQIYDYTDGNITLRMNITNTGAPVKATIRAELIGDRKIILAEWNNTNRTEIGYNRKIYAYPGVYLLRIGTENETIYAQEVPIKAEGPKVFVKVTDNEGPIQYAEVRLNGQMARTNGEGIAELAAENGTYEIAYFIPELGYAEKENVTVNQTEFGFWHEKRVKKGLLEVEYQDLPRRILLEKTGGWQAEIKAGEGQYRENYTYNGTDANNKTRIERKTDSLWMPAGEYTARIEWKNHTEYQRVWIKENEKTKIKAESRMNKILALGEYRNENFQAEKTGRFELFHAIVITKEQPKGTKEKLEEYAREGGKIVTNATGDFLPGGYMLKISHEGYRLGKGEIFFTGNITQEDIGRYHELPELDERKGLVRISVLELGKTVNATIATAEGRKESPAELLLDAGMHTAWIEYGNLTKTVEIEVEAGKEKEINASGIFFEKNNETAALDGGAIEVKAVNLGTEKTTEYYGATDTGRTKRAEIEPGKKTNLEYFRELTSTPYDLLEVELSGSERLRQVMLLNTAKEGVAECAEDGSCTADGQEMPLRWKWQWAKTDNISAGEEVLKNRLYYWTGETGIKIKGIGNETGQEMLALEQPLFGTESRLSGSIEKRNGTYNITNYRLDLLDFGDKTAVLYNESYTSVDLGSETYTTLEETKKVSLSDLRKEQNEQISVAAGLIQTIPNLTIKTWAKNASEYAEIYTRKDVDFTSNPCYTGADRKYKPYCGSYEWENDPTPEDSIIVNAIADAGYKMIGLSLTGNSSASGTEGHECSSEDNRPYDLIRRTNPAPDISIINNEGEKIFPKVMDAKNQREERFYNKIRKDYYYKVYEIKGNAIATGNASIINDYAPVADKGGACGDYRGTVHIYQVKEGVDAELRTFKAGREGSGSVLSTIDVEDFTVCYPNVRESSQSFGGGNSPAGTYTSDAIYDTVMPGVGTVYWEITIDDPYYTGKDYVYGHYSSTLRTGLGKYSMLVNPKNVKWEINTGDAPYPTTSNFEMVCTEPKEHIKAYARLAGERESKPFVNNTYTGEQQTGYSASETIFVKSKGPQLMAYIESRDVTLDPRRGIQISIDDRYPLYHYNITGEVRIRYLSGSYLREFKVAENAGSKRIEIRTSPAAEIASVMIREKETGAQAYYRVYEGHLEKIAIENNALGKLEPGKTYLLAVNAIGTEAINATYQYLENRKIGIPEHSNGTLSAYMQTDAAIKKINRSGNEEIFAEWEPDHTDSNLTLAVEYKDTGSRIAPVQRYMQNAWQTIGAINLTGTNATRIARFGLGTPSEHRNTFSDGETEKVLELRKGQKGETYLLVPANISIENLKLKVAPELYFAGSETIELTDYRVTSGGWGCSGSDWDNNNWYSLCDRYCPGDADATGGANRGEYNSWSYVAAAYKNPTNYTMRRVTKYVGSAQLDNYYRCYTSDSSATFDVNIPPGEYIGIDQGGSWKAFVWISKVEAVTDTSPTISKIGIGNELKETDLRDNKTKTIDLTKEAQEWMKNHTPVGGYFSVPIDVESANTGGRYRVSVEYQLSKEYERIKADGINVTGIAIEKNATMRTELARQAKDTPVALEGTGRYKNTEFGELDAFDAKVQTGGPGRAVLLFNYTPAIEWRIMENGISSQTKIRLEDVYGRMLIGGMEINANGTYEGYLEPGTYTLKYLGNRSGTAKAYQYIAAAVPLDGRVTKEAFGTSQLLELAETGKELLLYAQERPETWQANISQTVLTSGNEANSMPVGTDDGAYTFPLDTLNLDTAELELKTARANARVLLNGIDIYNGLVTGAVRLKIDSRLFKDSGNALEITYPAETGLNWTLTRKNTLAAIEQTVPETTEIGAYARAETGGKIGLLAGGKEYQIKPNGTYGWNWVKLAGPASMARLNSTGRAYVGIGADGKYMVKAKEDAVGIENGKNMTVPTGEKGVPVALEQGEYACQGYECKKEIRVLADNSTGQAFTNAAFETQMPGERLFERYAKVRDLLGQYYYIKTNEGCASKQIGLKSWTVCKTGERYWMKVSEIREENVTFGGYTNVAPKVTLNASNSSKVGDIQEIRASAQDPDPAESFTYELFVDGMKIADSPSAAYLWKEAGAHLIEAKAKDSANLTGEASLMVDVEENNHEPRIAAYKLCGSADCANTLPTSLPRGTEKYIWFRVKNLGHPNEVNASIWIGLTDIQTGSLLEGYALEKTGLGEAEFTQKLEIDSPGYYRVSVRITDNIDVEQMNRTLLSFQINNMLATSGGPTPFEEMAGQRN